MSRLGRLAFWNTLFLLVIPAGALLAQPDEPEAISLLGHLLYRPEIPAESRARLEEDLARARAQFEENPGNAEALIWLGRRTAYLGRYREAIAIYSQGIEKNPENPRLYRHRGHRYITLRELDKAVADLEKASQLIYGASDEIELDGMPNASNVPRSTLHSNIWYHLGLAHYLRGEFSNAGDAFSACRGVSRNDDMLVAASYWLYLSFGRMERNREAEEVLASIGKEMEIIENFAYHDLLLLFRGENSAESMLDSREANAVTEATLGYGVGAWYLLSGQPDKAKAVWHRVLEGGQWAAFGFLAAEADLARGSLP